jgi:GT2 family glycosyltransferase
MKIGFVFTNYNNTHYTMQAIKSIYDDCGGHQPVVVIVDNASNAAEVAALIACREKFPEVRYIFNKKNVGYFAGLNCGLDLLIEREAYLDCIVVGNNDLVFPPQFFGQVYDARHLFEQYAVLAPDIVTLDGEHQNPHVLHEPSLLRKLLWDIYYSNYNLAQLMQWVATRTRVVSGRKDHLNHRKAQPVLEGYGACYLLGPRFIAEFGRLWSPTFLMGEESFLKFQLASKGYQVFFEPAIIVRHHDHVTTNKVPGLHLWQYGREAHRICRKLDTARAGARNQASE